MPERRPRLLAENLFSVTQFPGRVLTTSGEIPGFEGYRAATGRRTAIDVWISTATPAWISTALGAARGADMLVLDRGHSLAGVECVLEGSADGVAWTEVVTFTPPAAPSPGGTELLDGATTEEGAFVINFTTVSWAYWRLYIAAGGAVTLQGLWVGRSWQPEFFFDTLPDQDGTAYFDETVTAGGWRGATLPTFIREGSLNVRLSSFEEYYSVGGPRDTIVQHYMRRRPCWMVLDQGQAQDAFCGIIPGGSRVEWGIRRSGWTYRSASIPYVEHEPRPFR